MSATTLTAPSVSAVRRVIPNTVVTSSGSSPFWGTSPGPRSGQVRTARTTVGTAMARAPARPSGHQRRVGSRPSGNRSGRNTTPMTMPGTKAQLASQLPTGQRQFPLGEPGGQGGVLLGDVEGAQRQAGHQEQPGQQVAPVADHDQGPDGRQDQRVPLPSR